MTQPIVRKLCKRRQRLVLEFIEDWKSPLRMMNYINREGVICARYRFGWSSDDLEQLGFLYVVKAAGKYLKGHPKKAKFSSYAGWWIRAALDTVIRRNVTDDRRRDLSLQSEEYVPDNFRLEATEAALDVVRYLDVLNDAQRLVIVHRFGVNGHEQMCQRQISEMMGLTRQRVQQIEASALRKMREETCLQRS